jgi:pSer/pThr/pTyr-binding forkhead associated (FHA) protein
MSLHAKTFLNLIAGAVAGLLAWLLTDATGWYAIHLENRSLVSASDPSFVFYGAVFGLLLGLLLGIVDALSLDSKQQMIITLVSGALIGFLGGGIGASVGQTVYSAIPGTGSHGDNPGLFFVQLFARAVGYGVVGAIVGAAQGIGRRSPLIIRQGAFGGLFGGLLGGAIFQVIYEIFIYVPHIDVISRLTALVATGALTGFFIGLVQDLFKQAWVKVMVGRNEGKEYLIAKAVTTIGRSELSDIGLYGDPSIAPTHAVIESLADQNRHRLRHVAGGQGAHAYPPTIVNGHPITAEQWLTDGDTIQIGGRMLMFAEKATRSAPRPMAAPALNTGAPRQVDSYPAPPLLGTGGNSSRPPLGMPPDVVAQMGTLPEPTVPLTPVLAQFSDSVTLKDFNIPSQNTTRLITEAAGSRLTAVRGPYTGQSFPLGHLPVTIGRSQDRDVALPADSSVSRTHARVTYEGNRHMIADDGSSNGTLVNGLRLNASRPLRPGDVVQMGETELRYE